MRSDVLGRAEELVDVALSVTYMNAAGWAPKQRGRPAQIVKPTNALLLLDRYARGIDLFLQRVRALESLARPELDCRQAEWQSISCHSETRMRQNATRGVEPWAPITVDTCYADCCPPDRLDIITLVGKLGCIVHHQNRAISRRHSISRCVKVAGENLAFTDPVIVQESIRGLRVGPVLANQRNTVAKA